LELLGLRGRSAQGSESTIQGSVERFERLHGLRQQEATLQRSERRQRELLGICVRPENASRSHALQAVLEVAALPIHVGREFCCSLGIVADGLTRQGAERTAQCSWEP
jgi:hypothetical protein